MFSPAANNRAQCIVNNISRRLHYQLAACPTIYYNRNKRIKQNSESLPSEQQQNDTVNRIKFTSGQLNELCIYSFSERARNFQNSTNIDILELPLAAIEKQKWWSSKEFKRMNNLETRLDNLQANLKTSYVSNDTFAENKADLMPNRNSSSNASRVNNFVIVTNLVNQLCRANFANNFTQVRGFKTQRSIESQVKRNPTFLSRVQQLFGLSVKLDPSLTVTSLKMFGHRNETLQKLLTQAEGTASQSNDQKQRIKIAFAEGYIAAARKIFYLLRQFATVIFLIVLIVILVKYSNIGSDFGPQKTFEEAKAEVVSEKINVTFNDVKGCDEAKQELHEVVEFLRNPKKFSTLGGKLPKGVLMIGEPGTGKTLLARAVASEAGVPFFHANGSAFDDALVGQGARRVHDLFKSAKERAPCVIFIDEIDSIGAERTNSVLYPHANQTINQLLSEMDGFHQNEGVIVLGATNRRDDLDAALLRPGRFDVQVFVPIPDVSGREAIISMYLEKVLYKDVDVPLLARRTTGFTGADLANMINQAALRAAIDGAEVVTMKHLENERDKIVMGAGRKVRLLDEETKQITAYHEAGHVIVAYYTQETHSVHKVTILPYGSALGSTDYLPENEMYYERKDQLLAMIDTNMGGRAAEELIFGPEKITSGASNDLKHATSIAQNMVRKWGMSDKIGLRAVHGVKLGPSKTDIIDDEIERILSESYERAKNVLRAHAEEHKAVAEALLKHETLYAEDIKAILSGEKKPDKVVEN